MSQWLALVALVNHARPRKFRVQGKCFSFNFDKSDKICLQCNLLSIGRNHRNPKRDLSRIDVSCSNHVDLKLTLIKLDSWCVILQSEVLAGEMLDYLLIMTR